MTYDTPFLVQPGYNTQAGFAARLHGDCLFVPFEDLEGAPHGRVPIGTVEYCRKYADIHGIALPNLDTYPEPLRRFLGRVVRRTTFALAMPDEFVKPLRCKAFTGGVKRTIQEAIDPNEPVYASDAVTFLAEWRAYVHHAGDTFTVSQYGDGEDRESPTEGILEMVLADGWVDVAPAGYALDVGMLADGRLVLVEVNDGWGLGLYRGCSPHDYLTLVSERWREISGS